MRLDLTQPEELGESPTKMVVTDQEIGSVAPDVADLEDRCLLPDEARHVKESAQSKSLHDTERHN